MNVLLLRSRMMGAGKFCFSTRPMPDLAVNTDAPTAALRAGRGSPVTFVR